MGILGFSVEEKIAAEMKKEFGQWPPLNTSSKGDITRQARILLGMYQDGVISGKIEPYNTEKTGIMQPQRAYLNQRSMLPDNVVIAFLESLQILVFRGEIDLKHLNPLEAKTKAKTTDTAKKTKEMIENWTPETIKSVFDFDLPEMINRNIKFLSISIIGAGVIYFLYTQKKGEENARTT